MGESHVITGLKTKRARIAGEIIKAQEIVARRTKEPQLLILQNIYRLNIDIQPESF
jgi:hypothetical protein